MFYILLDLVYVILLVLKTVHLSAKIITGFIFAVTFQSWFCIHKKKSMTWELVSATLISSLLQFSFPSSIWQMWDSESEWKCYISPTPHFYMMLLEPWFTWKVPRTFFFFCKTIAMTVFSQRAQVQVSMLLIMWQGNLATAVCLCRYVKRRLERKGRRM